MLVKKDILGKDLEVALQIFDISNKKGERHIFPT